MTRIFCFYWATVQFLACTKRRKCCVHTRLRCEKDARVQCVSPKYAMFATLCAQLQIFLPRTENKLDVSNILVKFWIFMIGRLRKSRMFIIPGFDRFLNKYMCIFILFHPYHSKVGPSYFQHAMTEAINRLKLLNSMSTAIPRWIHRFSSDHRS